MADDHTGGSRRSQGTGAQRAIQPANKGRKVAVIILSIVAVVAALVGIGAMFLINVVPTKFLLPLVVGEVVVAAIAVLLFRGARRPGHRAHFVIATILTVLLVVGNGVLVKASSDYLGLTHGIQASGETVQYDIVALKSGGPTTLSELAGKSVSEVSTDTNQSAVHDNMTKLVGQVNYAEKDNWTDALGALKDNSVQGSVLQDSFLQIFADANPSDYANIVILGTFKVTLGTSAAAVPTGADQPFIMYLSGIDTDGPINARSRSDVNQLIVVNPKTGKMLFVFTPRDYYVQLAGTTGLKDKLTHSGVYGIDTSVNTLQNLYGITINYYLRLNFSSMVKIVDTIGGIDVYSDTAFTTLHGHYQIQQGMNHLNGDQTLGFVRERHSLAGGDRGRGVDEQDVMQAIFKKMTEPSNLTNFPTLMNELQSVFQTSMPADAISAQVKQQLATNRQWNISTYSVNGSDSSQLTYSYPSQPLYVMIPDQSTVDAAKQKIAAVMAG